MVFEHVASSNRLDVVVFRKPSLLLSDSLSDDFRGIDLDRFDYDLLNELLLSYNLRGYNLRCKAIKEDTTFRVCNFVLVNEIASMNVRLERIDEDEVDDGKNHQDSDDSCDADENTSGNLKD